MALICSNCGKILPDDAKFCGECGTTVVVEGEKPNYCANCFAELPASVKFCLQCGKPAVIARPAMPLPEYNKAIYDELQKSTPQYKKYLADEAIYKATGKYQESGDEVLDFEQHKAEIARRARKWAENVTNNLTERIHWFQELSWRTFPMIIEDCFNIEDSYGWFPTNKPNHHKALFFEECIKHYLYQFRTHGVLTYDDPPQPTPLFFDYKRKVVGWTDEELTELIIRLPDLEEIRAWATKDDELFPQPQPIQVEVAGTILNFTSDEGCMVVYVDSVHKGKTLEIDNLSELCLSDYPDKSAEIRERTIGNSVFCVAIINHIPFVTNKIRHDQKVLTQMNCRIRTKFLDFKKSWEEKVTLDRGLVTVVDWRGKEA